MGLSNDNRKKAETARVAGHPLLSWRFCLHMERPEPYAICDSRFNRISAAADLTGQEEDYTIQAVAGEEAPTMICPTCQTESHHIKVIGDRAICHNCGGFSETGGPKVDKILTYNADRITEQQIQHEGDMITPYIVDKSTNQAIVNQDFIDKYPNQAAQTFSQEELKASGNENLKPPEKDDDGSGIEFKGSQEEAMREVVDES